MTREEAIETLKLLKPNMRFDNSGWLYTKQAIEMAIQALEQNESAEEWYKLFVEKFESCEDAISREAVIEKLNEWDWQELYLPIHFKEHIIDELPPVTPSRRKGRWEDLHRCWICSECNQETHVEYKYCPNCGAKMAESQESEDKG